MFESAAERAGLRATVDCPPLPEPVYVDREMWAKIVLNLLSNALKFTFDGRRSRCGVARRDGRGASSASPTPASASPRPSRPHLFERFHRVSGARSRTHEGSGIGLALVAELAALHGGTVDVAQRAGRGQHASRCGCRSAPRTCPRTQRRRERGDGPRRRGRLRPRASSPRRRAGSTPTDAAAVAAGRRRRTAPRVLVVDDNADMREYVAGLLADELPGRARPRDGVDGARRGPGAAARPGAHRRDDAADGRLRAARRAAAPTRDRRTCRSSCCRPGPARRAPSRASTPAPTTTWSSRSPPGSCWPGCAPTSSSTGPAVPVASSSAAGSLLDQAQRLARRRQLGDRPRHRRRSEVSDGVPPA